MRPSTLVIVVIGLICLLVFLLPPHSVRPIVQREVFSAPSAGGPGGASSQPATRNDLTSRPAEGTVRRVHFFVSGNVQGVGFRAYTRRTAMNSKLAGWVKNLQDGRVEGVAEGPGKIIDRFLDQVKLGPSGSRVTGLEVKDEPPTGEFRSFDIVPD